MRDVVILAPTMRTNRAGARGVASRSGTQSGGYVWHAGSPARNSQAVRNRLADGRRGAAGNKGRAQIAAVPSFPERSPDG